MLEINELLKQQPEYKEIESYIEEAQYNAQMVGDADRVIDNIQREKKVYQDALESAEKKIIELLLKLEENTGYSKAPGLAHLKNVAEKYEVTNKDAVPEEYLVTKKEVDKNKLNKAINDGKISKEANWIEVIPSYKTLVLK